jgi:hypothetical protein
MAMNLEQLMKSGMTMAQVDSSYQWGAIETEAYEIYTDLFSATRAFAEPWQFNQAIYRLGSRLNHPLVAPRIRAAMQWRKFHALFDDGHTLTHLVQHPLECCIEFLDE